MGINLFLFEERADDEVVERLRMEDRLEDDRRRGERRGLEVGLGRR